MPKSFRYKIGKVCENTLNTSKGRVVDRRRIGEKPKIDKVKFKKCLKIIVSVVLLLFLLNWLYSAYATFSTIRITDVVEGYDEVIDFAQKDEVRKTIIVYEDPESEEERNLLILLVIFNTDTSDALIYHFPEDLYIREDFNGKYISVADLTYAGNTYMYKAKYAYVLGQISNQIAMDIDSYIWIGSEMGSEFFGNNRDWSSEKDVLKIFSSLSTFRLLTTYRKSEIIVDSLYSNMNFIEVYRYLQQIRGVIGLNNYRYINLADEGTIDEVTLGTGRKVDVLNLGAFDKTLISNYGILMSRKLAREHVKVEVYNGSNVPMYARKVARRIYNSGCNVVRYTNSPETYEKNYIYIPNPEEYQAGLAKILTIVEDPVIVEERPDFFTTGDIIVVLGINKE
jgi:hypothetical protein